MISKVLRAVSLCAPVALVNATTASAQDVASAPLATAIPAQPLTLALAAFADQTGLQIAYVAGIVQNQKSRAVAAGTGVGEALTRLLRGTGLEFEYLTPRSIRILSAKRSSNIVKKPATGEAQEEIIVTASRRSEALQDVPITMQVLTGAALDRLNATTFDDLVGYLPGVTAHGVGPAQNNIYMRGLGLQNLGNQASGTNGAFPNVAVYLDEQSAQLPGRNLDVYAADLDRIEVLEGPQGTLFGAGAQAGVLRYITNKPKIDVTEAAMDAGYAVTAHGDPSTALEAVINLPLVPEKLAARAVIYSEKRGGYIDNPPAVFARSAADRSVSYANFPAGCGAPGAPACRVPPDSVVVNNASLTGGNFNPVTYEGIRAEALLQFNENWSALIAQSYQNMTADGVFAEEEATSLGQPLPALTVQLFNPSYDKDRFENSAVTVDGRVGGLNLLYAGSYLSRHIDQKQDYTNYARGGIYVDYYQCVNPGATSATSQCFTPSSFWRDQERNTHLSQELRLSTSADWRVRGVGGMFYENYRIHDQDDWFYLTATPYFVPIAPPTAYNLLNGKVVNGAQAYGTDAVSLPGAVTSNNPNVRPLGDGFFNDTTRGYSQKAAYASMDLDLIPRSLTLTAGTRYFNTSASEVGSSVASFGCSLLSTLQGPLATVPCINRDATNLNALGLARTSAGFRSRANLSWKIDEDVLIYYTWSQGFRAGNFNRGLGEPPPNSPLFPGPAAFQAMASQHGGWTMPLSSAPDNLINNELGWKSEWWGSRLQWNGAVYQENWKHTQVDVIESAVFGASGSTINGGNYRVNGLEVSALGRLTSGLSIEGSAAWNHGELTKEATFYWADGTPINLGALRTSAGASFPNPGGTLGSSLAGAPTFQGKMRARYEFEFNGYHAFAQVGANHQSHSLATTDRLTRDLQGNSIAYDLPGFTTCDGALGIGKDGWLVQAYGQNLTDTHAELWANYSLYYKAVTVNRPRTVGVRISYKR